MTNEKHTPKDPPNYLVRGILLGASLGVFAGLFGLDMGRSVAWGMVGGFFAGLTLEKKRERNR
ncbi:MAG: hypothetical protein AB7E47_14330 [Desulfovibrionaceae bacterium]